MTKELRSVKFDKTLYNDYYNIIAGFKRLGVKKLGDKSCSVRTAVEKALANYLPQLQKELEALKEVQK